VDAGSACLDHRLHQLEGVQHAAEAGFRVSNDRRHEMGRFVAFHMGDLVGAAQRVVDALDTSGTEEADTGLVRIHLPAIGVRRPANRTGRWPSIQPYLCMAWLPGSRAW
jgi:hypothetical protein